LGKTLDSKDDRPPKPSPESGPRREGDWIAGRLRRVYDEVRAEPLPDQFLVLLGKISGREEQAADDANPATDETPAGSPKRERR
jgi:hypothetical protein